MKQYFILNPVAGSGKNTNTFLEKFEKLKANHPGEVELLTTTKPGDAKQFAHDIALSHNDEVVVYACGGDGTMGDVTSGIIGHKNIHLGVVPIGSCNDFLKSFPDNDFLDLEKLFNGYDKEVDVIKANDSYAINVINIGFDAKTNYDQILLRSKYKSVKKAYRMAIVKNLLKPLGDPVKIIADGKEVFDGKALLIAMGNAKYYGGGFKCAPEAVVDDGLIDLFFVRKVSVIRFLILVSRFKKGILYGNEKFTNICGSYKAKNISIVSSDNLVGCFDGETVIKQKFDIECCHKALYFRMPKNN